MEWRRIVRDYLSFTRKDRIGILVLLIMIIIVLLLPKFLAETGRSRPLKTDTAWVTAMKRLEQKMPENDNRNYHDGNYTYHYDRTKNHGYSERKEELFYFDPNTLSTEGWSKLGIRDKTIHIIQNYLDKGGHFRKPEDLQRIYGLRTDEYERLVSFVRIESQEKTDTNKEASDKKTFGENKERKTYTSRYLIIDINSADTAAFISLPGIGSKLAARIVNFRDKLGGFYSIAQVRETFGLPDSTFQKIKQYLKLENLSVKKININTATVDELKAHPYIRWSLANPIISYRNEHGPFAKVEDLKKIMVFTEELYNKIAPYLTQ